MPRPSVVLSLILILLAGMPLHAQEDPRSPSWGFCADLQMGYHAVTGDLLETVRTAGYGTIQGANLVALFGIGACVWFPDLFTAGIFGAYFGGGSFPWEGLLGDPWSSFSLMRDCWAVYLTATPLFLPSRAVLPFLGAGYAFTDRLVDPVGEGFVGGEGPFLHGGIDIDFLAFLEPEAAAGPRGRGWMMLRVSATWRLPYRYSFLLSWDEVDFLADKDPVRTFFSREFPAGAWSIGAGLTFNVPAFPF